MMHAIQSKQSGVLRSAVVLAMAALMVVQTAIVAKGQDNGGGPAGNDDARGYDAARHQRDIARYGEQEPEGSMSHEQLRALIHDKFKYVFVIYQENRSFDSYFGTFPRAEGLYSQPANKTPGFTQKIVNPDGIRDGNYEDRRMAYPECC